MIRSALVLAGALTALSTSVAPGQRPDSLPAGALLRVTVRNSPVGELFGTLEAADSTELLLTTSTSRSTYRLRYAEIESVSIARGHEPRPGGAARGAMRGLKIGAGIGALATAIAFAYDLRAKEESFVPASVVIGIYGVGLIGVTTAMGAAIGATSRTRWEHVWPR